MSIASAAMASRSDSARRCLSVSSAVAFSVSAASTAKRARFRFVDSSRSTVGTSGCGADLPGEVLLNCPHATCPKVVSDGAQSRLLSCDNESLCFFSNLGKGKCVTRPG